MEVGDKISEIEVPLISVIVPAYNIEQYLPNCLDSILAQTYKNIEIILIDDGSEDETAHIADRYAAKYYEIRCIHQNNEGVARARLAGIAVAKGEWIGFVDGDDLIEADMYERLMRNAIKYHTDISHCGYQTIVNNGERVHFFYKTGRLVLQDRKAGLKDLLEGSFVEPGLWNKLFRKTLFRSLLYSDVLDTGIRINEDLLMNYILFKTANSSVYEDFCPYHYMARSVSATRSKCNEHKVLDPVKVRKWILEDAEPEIKDIALQKYLLSCMRAYTKLYEFSGYQGKCRELKVTLKQNQNKWLLLERKDRIKLRLIMFSPVIYNGIYRFYESCLQRKLYE